MLCVRVYKQNFTGLRLALKSQEAVWEAWPYCLVSNGKSWSLAAGAVRRVEDGEL